MEKIKISDYIKQDELLDIKNKAWTSVDRMYNRQQESGAGYRYKRYEKIFIGFLTEILIQRYISVKYSSHLENISFENINSDDPDFFDIEIYGYKFDIKSSKENRKISNNLKYEDFILENRNFILPVDQSNSGEKHYILQVMYQDIKDGYAYIAGCIPKYLLSVKENEVELRLNNNKYQKTYMMQLKHGKSLDYIIGLISRKPKTKEKSAKKRSCRI